MPTQTEESKALLHGITEEIWCNGRLELIDELISEDIVDHIRMPGTDGTGREHYRATVLAIRGAFPDYHEEILWSVGEGDLAVSYTRLTGTHEGPLYGMEPTGKRVEFNTMGALRFASGQAVERWGFGDTAAMMEQLGLVWFATTVKGLAATVPLGAWKWTITQPTIGRMLSYRGVSRRVTRWPGDELWSTRPRGWGQQNIYLLDHAMLRATRLKALLTDG